LERRESIVKSIDKLASSIATDEANSVAATSSSTMMPMFMVMQMQRSAASGEKREEKHAGSR
jgi:hypothetical protein